MKTNYVIAADYDPTESPENIFIVGWNNNYDWFDCETNLDDIVTDDDKLPDTECGLIEVDRWTSVYVGETVEDVKEYAESARKEGIDATILQVEIVDGELKVTLVE